MARCMRERCQFVRDCLADARTLHQYLPERLALLRSLRGGLFAGIVLFHRVIDRGQQVTR